MKKVYLILTLFVASLFFYSNKVYAATYTYEVSEETMSLINDDFFLFREKVLQYVEETNSPGYIIFFRDNIFESWVFNSDYWFFFTDGASSYDTRVSYTIKNFKRVQIDENKNIKVISTTTSQQSWPFLRPDAVLHFYIDSNLPLTSRLTDTFLLNYNDLTYTIEKSMEFPTLYQIYLDHNPPVEEEPVPEEITLLNNFYFSVIEKITILSNELSNNYIFLTIIGIIILIFISELIFRRLL